MKERFQNTEINNVCRNFVKELVILFHRISAAPWGHVVSTIKKSYDWRFFHFSSTPTAVSNRSIRSRPWRQTYLVPSTCQDPKATNAHAKLKGIGHTAKFQQAFYLQNLTLPYLTLNPTLPYLKLLPYNFILHLYLKTTLQLNLTNLTKPYHLSEPWTLFWTLTYSLFVPFGVKPCLLLSLLNINFVTLKVVRLLSSKAVTHFPTAVEVRFILLLDVGINRAFRGL